ncbi:MAG: DUF5606 domain-containing protein [Edaphocola sp.]
MEYRQIVAVTGLSGLYHLMSTKSDGAIVRSLTDKSVKFVSARVHHITPLESIEIYTTGDNVRLHEIFEKIKEDDSQVAAINSKKDDKATKAFFTSILPNYDQDRVYTSDIRKVFKWYELLKANDLLDFDYLKQQNVQQAEEQATDKPIAEEAVATEEKPKKKAAAKKATDGADTEKPVKKAAAKKKTEAASGEEKPAKKATTKKAKEDA